MLAPTTVLAVLSLLQLSLSALSPAHPAVTQRRVSGGALDRAGRDVARAGVKSRDGALVPRQRPSGRRKRLPLPDLGFRGLEVPVHRHSGSQWQRRGEHGNGTILPFATEANTYIIPVDIGTPPTTFPLQLDIGSSDLLLVSTLCSNGCPSSGSNYPFYDAKKQSATFGSVNGNTTLWKSSFGDGTVASGFIALEAVNLGGVKVVDQVFGLINATNLTLADQEVSGILGLGFPRLSSVTRAALGSADSNDSSVSASLSSSTSDPSSSTSASPSSSSTAPSASSSATATYYPPLLEHLVNNGTLPYPVFGLALAPPPQLSSTTSSSASASPSVSARYKEQIGSITLGGVSHLYVSNDTASGRTLEDIEWHDVVPFTRALKKVDTTNATSSTNGSDVSSSATPTSTSTSSDASSSDGARRRRSSPDELDGLPTSIDELDGEEYVFWTLQLSNVTVNGTDIPLNPTYASLGLGSIAILDVGSNGIWGPAQDVEKLFGQITDSRVVSDGQWAVPCNTRATIGFSFGGRYVQLQPSDWMYAQVSGSSFCLAWPRAMASSGDGIDWQLGTPFLKNVYSVFSYGINGAQAPLVGFLPLASTSTATTSTSASASAPSASASSTTSADSDSPTPTTIESLSLTVTVQTTLPNAVLADPSYTTPSYIYSTPTLAPGVTQYLGLSNSSDYQVGDVPVISPAANASTSSYGGSSSQSDSTPSAGSPSTSEVPYVVLLILCVLAPALL